MIEKRLMIVHVITTTMCKAQIYITALIPV